MKLEDLEKHLEESQQKFQKLLDDQQKDFQEKLNQVKNDEINSRLHQRPTKRPILKTIVDPRVDAEKYAKFDKKPYFIQYNGKDSIYVVVPKFYPDFQVGWLKDELDEYYRYEVNQYSVFFGDVPEEILKEIRMPTPIRADVSGNMIHFDLEDRPEVKKRLDKFLVDWTDETARITKDHEFDIIDQILRSGRIPFKTNPVEEQDLNDGPHTIKLRPYQIPTWKKFMETGAIGIFHPTGAGKSFIAMKGLESLKGEKIIISPKLTLIEQWQYYINKYIPHAKDEITLSTYQGFKNYDKEFVLAIYDECQVLPATSFSRLSTIKTKYRMGLSATPYREDKKNSLIITLTGYPQALNWPQYMQQYGPGYHAVNVHIVQSRTGKIAKAKALYNPRKRTMIYSYDLSIGEEISNRLNLPFIHGDTTDRLQVMRDNKSFVASSVFTEGISIQDLEHIIEIDFHYGSRREELQLTGRLMHSMEKNKRHDILMTEHEFNNYSKRLWILEEKGFHVKILDGVN